MLQRSLSLFVGIALRRETSCISSSLSLAAAESTEKLRARLIYQSRNRGILENDLLLSTFAKENLNKFTETQLREYDALINNSTTNEWDIYYWCTGKMEAPGHVKNNSIFRLLVEHTKNAKREQRFHMPPL